MTNLQCNVSENIFQVFLLRFCGFTVLNAENK